MIYWFIGNCGAGKSTLAKMLKKDFNAKGRPSVYFDGDDLHKLFNIPYNKETLSLEYRSEQTRALQRLIAYIADQHVDVIVSTVNAYRNVREEFKSSRNDIIEFYVHTNEIRERDRYKVINFEEPLINYVGIDTGNGHSIEDSFRNVYMHVI